MAPSWSLPESESIFDGPAVLLSAKRAIPKELVEQSHHPAYKAGTSCLSPALSSGHGEHADLFSPSEHINDQARPADDERQHDKPSKNGSYCSVIFEAQCDDNHCNTEYNRNHRNHDEGRACALATNGAGPRCPNRAPKWDRWKRQISSAAAAKSSHRLKRPAAPLAELRAGHSSLQISVITAKRALSPSVHPLKPRLRLTQIISKILPLSVAAT